MIEIAAAGILLHCQNCGSSGQDGLPCNCTQNYWISWIAGLAFAALTVLIFLTFNIWPLPLSICLIVIDAGFLGSGIYAAQQRYSQGQNGGQTPQMGNSEAQMTQTLNQNYYQDQNYDYH